MEDTIEVCSGCGKMPRPIDRLEGYFVCTRCGSRSTMAVKSEDYERVVTELDSTFHQMSMKKKVEDAAKEPIDLSGRKKAKKSSTKAAKKTVKNTLKKAMKEPAKAKAAKRSKKANPKKRTAKRRR